MSAPLDRETSTRVTRGSSSVNSGPTTARVILLLLSAWFLVGCSQTVTGTGTGVPTPPSPTSVSSTSASLSSSGPLTVQTSDAPTGTSSPALSSGVVTVTSTTTAPPTTTPSPSVSTTAVAPAASPAPACWAAKSCLALGSAALSGGWRLVAVAPNTESTVIILLAGARPFDQLKLRSLGPRVALGCPTLSGVPTCLIDGVPGAHTAFGAVVQVQAGRIRALNTDLAAEGGFTDPSPVSDGLLFAGPVSTFSYGLSYAASPQAWRTYLIRGTTLTATGCGPPSFNSAGAPTTPQTGPCTGTPRIAGFGPESAGKLVDLNLGVISPTKNIWCVVQYHGKGELNCTIGMTDFTVPGNCSGQPGTIVSWPVGGQPQLSGCAGDTMVEAGRNLIPYGRLAVADGFGCVISQRGGVRCQDGTGHGFVLARAGYSTF